MAHILTNRSATGKKAMAGTLILGAVVVGLGLSLWFPLLIGAYAVALAVNACVLVLDGLRARMPQRIPLALLGTPVVALYDFLKVAAIALLTHAVRSIL